MLLPEIFYPGWANFLAQVLGAEVSGFLGDAIIRVLRKSWVAYLSSAVVFEAIEVHFSLGFCVAKSFLILS